MLSSKCHRASLCAALLLMLASRLIAADQSSQSNAVVPPSAPESSNRFSRLIAPYRSKTVPPVNLNNSNRLEALTRAGSIYLSLQDAMALALENNLDIEMERYGAQIADADLLHAQAGGFAAPVSTAVTAGAASVTGAPPSAGLQGLLVSGLTQTGSIISSLDPAIVGSSDWAHQTVPQSSSFVTGTSALIQHQDLSSVSVQKYWTTGTLLSLGLNNTSTTTNSARAQFNPSTNSSLSLNFTQHLLQGFGRSMNNRQIRIAKNNRELADLTFKAQVIATVSAIKDLYWDLVSYQENVKVQQDAMAASQRLYEDNKKQVAVGTLAPIEVTRAEAEIASDQQLLTVAQTQLLQQETILKNALSRKGVVSAELANAHIIPVDRIVVPEVEPITPIQDAAALALSARPELSQFRILIQNQQISIKGTKNELLPTLDVVASFANNGLAGTPVPLPPTCTNPALPNYNPTSVTCAEPNGFFNGGYGTVLTQLFARNFPTYSAGFNLNIPLHNRAAQADMINSELALRQQEIGIQRMENQVRVEVQNALIGLQQAQAQYQSAVKQRTLQVQTVDAEQKKLALGASTSYNVILTERDLVTAESNLVVAEGAYAKAKVEMDRATGQTLNNNNISIDEAFRGSVSRPPDRIPDVLPPTQPGR